jgi:hypothetical protein
MRAWSLLTVSSAPFFAPGAQLDTSNAVAIASPQPASAPPWDFLNKRWRWKFQPVLTAIEQAIATTG